jgi:Protein of unknown function (DUF2867)
MSASVQTLAPEATTAPLLTAADFADAYRLIVDGPPLDAAVAAHRIFARTPRWIGALLALRNRLGALIGLKGTNDAALDEGVAPEKTRRIGFFPVISETPDRLVMGFDDWHLDFRVVVDVVSLSTTRQEVTITTLVRTHNLAGRAYLTLIMPFHRIIARTMLAQAARS